MDVADTLGSGCMIDSPIQTSLVDPPLAIARVAAGALSAIALVSAMGMAGVALFMGAQPYWMLVGMEVCIVLAGVFGLLFLRKKFSDGPALALLCVAGTIFAASVLSWLSVSRGITLKGDRTVDLKWLMYARIGLAALLAGLASVEVLRRNVLSRGFLLRAVATGMPLLVIAGGLYAGRNVLASQKTVPEWIVWTLVSVGAVIAMALLCACGHFVIRAFEMGRPENQKV